MALKSLLKISFWTQDCNSGIYNARDEKVSAMKQTSYQKTKLIVVWAAGAWLALASSIVYADPWWGEAKQSKTKSQLIKDIGLLAQAANHTLAGLRSKLENVSGWDYKSHGGAREPYETRRQFPVDSAAVIQGKLADFENLRIKLHEQTRQLYWLAKACEEMDQSEAEFKSGCLAPLYESGDISRASNNVQWLYGFRDLDKEVRSVLVYDAQKQQWAPNSSAALDQFRLISMVSGFAVNVEIVSWGYESPNKRSLAAYFQSAEFQKLRDVVQGLAHDDLEVRVSQARQLSRLKQQNQALDQKKEQMRYRKATDDVESAGYGTLW